MAIKIDKHKRIGVAPYTSPQIINESVGVGYVFIPEDRNRDDFVDTCFRTMRMSVIDDNGNPIHNCYVTKEVLQQIRFPRNAGEIGDSVVWVCKPFLAQPVVVGTFVTSDEPDFRSDQELRVLKQWNQGAIDIHGSSKEGFLTIDVRGEVSGDFQLNILGNDASRCRVFSTGDVDISANGKVKIQAYKEFEVGVESVIDEKTTYKKSILANQDTIEAVADYSTEDETKFLKTTISKEGRVTEITLGETEYKSEISGDKAEVVFKDCKITMEDKRVEVVQDGISIELKDGKIALKNNGTGLNDILKKIVDAVETLTVSTANGPSGTPLPPTIQRTTELKQLLSNFFNG